MPQLLVTVNDQTMLPRVRMAIKTLRGVDSVVTTRTVANKAKAEEKAIKLAEKEAAKKAKKAE